MSVQLYFGNQLTDEDLLNAKFSPNAIEEGLKDRIDFILVSPQEYTEETLWPVIRNIDRMVLSGSLEHRRFNFRDEEKLVSIFWH